MKMPTSLPYTDLLDPARREVFKLLGKFASEFVLAGGTAIMLQIGHRKSFDFDCFIEEDLPKNLYPKIRRVFGRYIVLKTRTPEIVTLITSSGVEVTFAWHPYKPLKKPIQTGTIPLFHLDDLITNKALTVGRRGAWRDYVDLFICLKWKLYTLEKIISLSEKRFEVEFNDKLFLQQLVYFDDLNVTKTVFIKKPYTPEEIMAFLENTVRANVEKNLS